MMISVRVHPNSSSVRIARKGKILHVYLTEPAKDNRANKQLLKVLGKEYGRCRIIRGASSKNKLIETT